MIPDTKWSTLPSILTNRFGSSSSIVSTATQGLPLRSETMSTSYIEWLLLEA